MPASAHLKNFSLIAFLAAVLISCSGIKPTKQISSTVFPARKIKLNGILGRIDHLALSANGKKIYIAGLGNNTLEVIDLETGRKDTSLAELEQPQAVLLSLETGKIMTTNGGDGVCTIFHCNTYKELATIDIGDDADNIRYDSAGRMAYVGYGNGGIALLDMNYSRQEGNIPLGAHPEGFELDLKRKLIYVNVPQSDAIEVADIEKKTVVASWKIPNAKGNFPMAFDESRHRIFIATRYPALCMVFDVTTGKATASWPCSGDADDIFYDKNTHMLFIICGEGFIDSFKEDPATGVFSAAQQFITRKGARTAIYIPSIRTIYVALPQADKQEAELWSFKL
jgi:DNA-binding beta-propeller fold protein YncE